MVTFEKNYIKCCFDRINTLILYFYTTKNLILQEDANSHKSFTKEAIASKNKQ
jgi:hypothetical protein